MQRNMKSNHGIYKQKKSELIFSSFSSCFCDGLFYFRHEFHSFYKFKAIYFIKLSSTFSNDSYYIIFGQWRLLMHRLFIFTENFHLDFDPDCSLAMSLILYTFPKEKL